MNGLFGTSHALDASVSYPATETISHGLRQLVSDVLVLIGGSCFYHIEAEMRYGKELVIRVFEYDVADAIQRRVFRDGKMHLKFPQTRIICWEARSSTPDRAVMSIEFPDGGTYDYSVEIFKFTDYDVGELEARRMILLLPFCLLRLR
ncbi:MAG: hypothetical protein LBR38_00255, partial [Synergistaceae bacterium]|nr:hypothetical protein [Synergistaceae bacterium]